MFLGCESVCMEEVLCSCDEMLCTVALYVVDPPEEAFQVSCHVRGIGRTGSLILFK